MIVHARDEAHRFVNSYHRKKRSKGSLRNPLENVEGLGAKNSEPSKAFRWNSRHRACQRG